MDQKVFKNAEMVTSSTQVKKKANLVIEYPLNVRHGFAEYWQLKMLRLWLQSTPLTPDEVLPELFLIKESAPKKLSKDVCITQTHRTNEGRKNENKYFKTK